MGDRHLRVAPSQPLTDASTRCSCPSVDTARGGCRCGQGPVIRKAIRPSTRRRSSAAEDKARDTRDWIRDKFDGPPDPKGPRPQGNPSRTPYDATLPRWECGPAPGEALDPGGNWVVSGNTLLDAADAADLDFVVSLFMAVNNIPSGAFAVVSGEGRLVHARGFTNRAAYDLSGEPTFFATPDSKFRIGGVSQLVTAIATLQLDEAGLLPSGLESMVSPFVNVMATPPWSRSSFPVAEPRGMTLTLKHLLTHTGGWFEGVPTPNADGWVDGVADPGIRWDPATSPFIHTVATPAGLDATRQYADIAAAFGSTLPVTQDEVLRHGNTLSMTWAPGTRYSAAGSS